MNEQRLEAVTEAVWQRLQKPHALIIGKLPPGDYPFVSGPEPAMVVLAELTPGQLLAMPTDDVCTALLEGKPVWMLPGSMTYQKYKATAARALYALLQSKERQLKALGVELLKADTHLITAAQVRRLKASGSPLPRGAKLTPLARDIWEGKT